VTALYSFGFEINYAHPEGNVDDDDDEEDESICTAAITLLSICVFISLGVDYRSQEMWQQ